MLAEQWEETEEEAKDLLIYTRELRENLHAVWEEAHSTLRESQNKQKQWYDAKSVFRSLKIGDKTLILLPSCENKLLAQWQGPYDDIEQINPTTYKLAIPVGQGHGGNTEVQEDRQLAFGRGGERGDNWRSGRERVGEDRRDQGAVCPNRGQEDRRDQGAVRPNQGREDRRDQGAVRPNQGRGTGETRKSFVPINDGRT
ncbi:hypothetical protein NDU88_005654 [Pleurodeles waltl]|uniref:Uncharacterized protein n=1 Tax=Pleurodeles waltl TaxID=8319 RepID=A0AAV7MAL9_PLEWA|nr:hypothetical protein NDU88_005654 [Pleurodeles waltl]